MALILCHSPVGGAGTSFIAAQIAMLMAQAGHEVTCVDFTYQETLKLFFGLPPVQALPDLAGRSADPTIVAGVKLVSGYRLSRDSGLHALLAKPQSPFAGAGLFIADVAAADMETKELLLPHALLHICPLLPGPTSLAALAKVQPGTPAVDLPKTVFVLNQTDDTRRLSQHAHLFLRQLFGPLLAGAIHRDEAVNEAAASLELLNRYAPASPALRDLHELSQAIERSYLFAGEIARETGGAR